MKITKNLEGVSGETQGELLYALAKAVFGADDNGVVEVPADLTAAPVSFVNTTVVAEINSKT